MTDTRPIPLDTLAAIAAIPDPAGIDWRAEFARLYAELRATQYRSDQIEAELRRQYSRAELEHQAQECADRLTAISGGNLAVELKAWSGESPNWTIWCAVQQEHFQGPTMAEAEARFCAAWAKWNAEKPVEESTTVN